MPRHSSILDHPRRERADALILAGDRPISAIARELGLPIESFKRYARRLRANSHAPVPLPAMSPIETFERAFGFPPMPHQRAYLEEKRPTVVLKARQVGMTVSAAALAVHIARSQPGSTSVVISPSLRQSSEVTARARLALWEW